MDLYFPESLLLNLNQIIKRQNEQLIKEICKWKGWDSKKLISEFLDDEVNFNLIDGDSNALTKLKNNITEPNRMENNISNNLEVRVRQNWVYNECKYLLETPSDNVYTLSGVFVGKKIDNFLDIDAEED